MHATPLSAFHTSIVRCARTPIILFLYDGITATASDAIAAPKPQMRVYIASKCLLYRTEPKSGQACRQCASTTRLMPRVQVFAAAHSVRCAVRVDAGKRERGGITYTVTAPHSSSSTATNDGMRASIGIHTFLCGCIAYLPT